MASGTKLTYKDVRMALAAAKERRKQRNRDYANLLAAFLITGGLIVLTVWLIVQAR